MNRKRIVITAIIIVLFILSLSFPKYTSANSAKEKNSLKAAQIIKKALKYTVKITVVRMWVEYSEDSKIDVNFNEDDFYKGTGIIINKKGWILTAAHLVKKAIPLEAELEYIDQSGKMQSYKYDLENFKIIYRDDDLALIKIKNFKSLPHMIYPQFENKPPDYGEQIFILGNIEGDRLFAGWGIVSNPSMFSDETKSRERINTNRFFVQDGASGGPVLNLKGKIIGIAVGYNKKHYYGLIIPSKTILKFLNENSKKLKRK